MKRKNITAVLTAFMLCIGLSGCGENQIPEMTAEELQMVGEYAAITLMKYDASRRSRLVELPEENVSETIEPEEAPEPGVPSVTEPEQNTAASVSREETAESSYTMEEVMGLPEGLSVSYQDYELCDYYPHDEEGSYLSVQAVSGKKLLVLHFSIINGSGEEKSVDLLSGDTAYWITVNGDAPRRALGTMLLDDMTTYSDTVPGGSNAEVVLIVEIEENTEPVSVSLKLKNDSKTHTIQLF